MQALWRRLRKGAAENTLNREERELAKKFAKAVKHLSANPFHPGLQSHEIDDLTDKFSQKVYESYLENNTPSAGRLFWVYGPNRRQISVVGLEPHPEDARNGAYRRVKLSALPLLSAATTDAVQAAFSEESGEATPGANALNALAVQVSAEARERGLDAHQVREAIGALVPRSSQGEWRARLNEFVSQCMREDAKGRR